MLRERLVSRAEQIVATAAVIQAETLVHHGVRTETSAGVFVEKADFASLRDALRDLEKAFPLEKRTES